LAQSEVLEGKPAVSPNRKGRSRNTSGWILAKDNVLLVVGAVAVVFSVVGDRAGARHRHRAFTRRTRRRNERGLASRL
jgi:hypothetical protein